MDYGSRVIVVEEVRYFTIDGFILQNEYDSFTCFYVEAKAPCVRALHMSGKCTTSVLDTLSSKP